eukprot:TRINITY_DN713_c0_g1_i2.p1 TRINITY_DN713_c0_g1~~TRINITY_DN713_c0_g1_i2.p1  ORF type:complete len:579 (+),score=118.50 TRINITY_DN713_c0_g1_i2:18-1754(+)
MIRLKSVRFLFFLMLIGGVIVVNVMWGYSLPYDHFQKANQASREEVGDPDERPPLAMETAGDERQEEREREEGGSVDADVMEKIKSLENQSGVYKEVLEGLMKTQGELLESDKVMEEAIRDQEKILKDIKEEISLLLSQQQHKHNKQEEPSTPRPPLSIPPPPAIPAVTTPIKAPPGNPTSDVTSPPSGKKRYLGLITGFGPNNQYLGTKETMFLAKQLNRTFVCSHYFLHDNVYLTVDSIRPFESTFKIKPLKSYIPAISMGEFVKKCGKIDTIVWMRDQTDEWKRRVGLLLDYLHVDVVREIKAPPAGNYHPVMRSMEDIQNYFSDISEDECVLLAFPFRNLGYEINNEVYDLLPKYLIHSDWVQEKAWEAIREMGIRRLDRDNADFISLHWRYGELTCKVEPPIVHEGYDFCWGTSIFYWSTMDDIYEAMKPLFEKFSNPVVFIATDIKETEEMYRKFLSFLSRIPKIRVFRASQLSCLESITDNYYLSLVEQEICSISKVFIRSTGSTWSDFVSDFVKCVDFKPIKATSFNKLLDAKNLPWTERNCFSDKRPIPRNGAIIKHPDVDPPYVNWFC